MNRAHARPQRPSPARAPSGAARRPRKNSDLQSELAEAHRRLEALEATLARKQHEIDVIEEELTRSNDFLREVHRLLPGALVILDGHERIFSANDETLRLVGYAREELLGRPLAELQVETELEPAERHALLHERQLLRLERTWIARDGTQIPVLLSMAVAGTDDALPNLFICVATDLRDQRRREMEVRQRQKLEAVGQLAAGVAHEINTPIQYVADSIHFLRESCGEFVRFAEGCRRLAEEAAAGAVDAPSLARQVTDDWESAEMDFLLENVPGALSRAIDGVTRVAEIVSAMREFSHPGGRARALTDLNRAVISTLTVARSEYKYVADIETDLGELPLVPCHAGEIGQVLLNLIVNAAHAISDVFQRTQIRGRITIRTRALSGFATLTISDTGPGISAEAREHMFEPFFTTKVVGRGTGQGLAIARAIIERHGGTIEFETEVGLGTSFTLRLPIAGLAADAVAGAAPRPDSGVIPP